MTSSFGSGVGSAALSPAKVGSLYTEGSSVCIGFGWAFSGVDSSFDAAGMSSHGFGDIGISGGCDGAIGAVECGREGASPCVPAIVRSILDVVEDAMDSLS